MTEREQETPDAARIEALPLEDRAAAYRLVQQRLQDALTADPR